MQLCIIFLVLLIYITSAKFFVPYLVGQFEISY